MNDSLPVLSWFFMCSLNRYMVWIKKTKVTHCSRYKSQRRDSGINDYGSTTEKKGRLKDSTFRVLEFTVDTEH